MASLLPMSEATALGLHAAALAAQSSGAVQMSAVAERLSASRAHLSKVLQALVRAGIMRSKRGPSGGYELARRADEIRLLDIFEALEGPIRSDGCIFERPVCDRARCILGDLVERMRGEVVDYLRETTLAQASGTRRS